jgi:hypothetical protein
MAKTIAQLTALGATPDDSDNLVIDDSGVTKKVTAGQLKGDCVRAGQNNALSSAVATRIGTNANQLLGFWNAAPVDQPDLTADLLDSLQEVGLIKSGAGDTPLNLSAGPLTCGAITAGATGVTSLAATGAVTAASAAVTGAVTAASVAATGAVTSSSGMAGVGYATGAGGTVTQATSRTTAVTIDKTCGSITMFSAAGSLTAATFTVNNSTVAINDVVILNQRSGTNPYEFVVTAVAAGSFNINFRSIVGTATDAPVINFAVIKAVTA